MVLTYEVDGVFYGKNCDYCREVAKTACDKAENPLNHCTRCSNKGIQCVWTPAKNQTGGHARSKQAPVSRPAGPPDVLDPTDPARTAPPPRNRRGLKKKASRAEEDAGTDGQSSGLSEAESNGDHRPGGSRKLEGGDNSLAEHKSPAGSLVGRGAEDRPIGTGTQMREKQPFKESAHIRSKLEGVNSPKSSRSRVEDTRGPHGVERSTKEDVVALRPDDGSNEAAPGPSKQDKTKDQSGPRLKKIKRVVTSDSEGDEDDGERRDFQPSIEDTREERPAVEGETSAAKITIKIPSASARLGASASTSGNLVSKRKKGVERPPENTDPSRTLSPESKKRKRLEKQRNGRRADGAVGQDGRAVATSGSEEDEGDDDDDDSLRHKKKKLYIKSKPADRLSALKSTDRAGSLAPPTPSTSGSRSPAVPGTPDSQQGGTVKRGDPDAMDVDFAPDSPAVGMLTKATGGGHGGGGAAAGAGIPKEVRQRIPKKGLGGRPPVDDFLSTLFKKTTGGLTSGSSTPTRGSTLGSGSAEHAFAALQRQEQAKRRAAILAKQVSLDLMGSGSAIQKFESDPLNFPSRSTIYNPPSSPSEVNHGSSNGVPRTLGLRVQSNGNEAFNADGGRGTGTGHEHEGGGLPYDGPTATAPSSTPSASLIVPPTSNGREKKVNKSVETVRRLLIMRDKGMLGI